MQRELLVQLLAWQAQAEHLPILLRGARQVGKTHLVEHFGRTYFSNLVSLNFELTPEYIGCFDTLKPEEILAKIEVLCGQRIVPGETLLFLDEIQVCPNAIMALRYFKEQCPQLHVIGAGSLLEFALREQGMRMPVGRVQYLYLKPLSFREFLNAVGESQLSAFLSEVTLETDIPDAIHNKALNLVRQYMAVGGMPMVVSQYLAADSLQACQTYQAMLLKTYSDDFSKYATTGRLKYLQQVYDKAPGLVGQQVKYSHISPEMTAQNLKEAIYDLGRAGVCAQVYATSAAGLPFITYAREKKFKLLFLDIGLLKRATKLDMDLLLAEDLILLNRGAMAEQFVGQELLAYQAPFEMPQLFYWARDKKSSSAEVDYLINVGSQIVPVEVKSGKTGTLKSLRMLMDTHQLPLGARISALPLSRQDNILSIPFYMIDQLPRLVAAQA